MEPRRLHVHSHQIFVVHQGAEWWVIPALCAPPLSWVKGAQLHANTVADPLPATPNGHVCTVATSAVLPLLLPAEAAALQKQHPRSTFLMSLPAALRNLRKTPRVKAQWKAVADDVFTSLENLEAYIHDLGGGAPGPAGAGAPAPNIHVRSMNYSFRAMGARGRLWVVQPAGSQIQKCGTAGGCSGHFGRRNLPQSFPSLDCVPPHMSPTPHPVPDGRRGGG